MTTETKTLKNAAALCEDGSGRTLWQEMRRRFKKNRMAVVALCVLSLLLLISVSTLIVDVATEKAFYKTYIVGQDMPNKLKAPSLESVRDLVPEKVFTTPYTNPVSGDPGKLRANLRTAMQLFNTDTLTPVSL